MSYATNLIDSPVSLLKRMIGDNFQTLFTVNEIDFNKIGWDEWYSGKDISIRFIEQFFTVFQGEWPNRVPIGVITDPYNIAKHYISTVDIHYFVRDYTLTDQENIIPVDMTMLLQRIEDFLEKNPLYWWELQGISNLYPSDQKANVPFDEPTVYHAIQSVNLEYTIIDKPLGDYTKS